jgi:hypothetical protein
MLHTMFKVKCWVTSVSWNTQNIKCFGLFNEYWQLNCTTDFLTLREEKTKLAIWSLPEFPVFKQLIKFPFSFYTWNPEVLTQVQLFNTKITYLLWQGISSTHLSNETNVFGQKIRLWDISNLHRMRSSGLWHCTFLQVDKLLEEHTACIFGVGVCTVRNWPGYRDRKRPKVRK